MNKILGTIFSKNADNENTDRRNLIANRLKTIREAYDLKAKEVAEICNISYRNYQNYENGKVEPTLGRLAALSNYTAVSLDWFSGITDTPYYEEYLTKLENDIWTYNEKNEPIILMDVYNDMTEKIEKLQIYPYAKLSILEDYADVEKRKKNYTLAARANIIFLIHRFVDLINKTDGSVLLYENAALEFHHHIFHAEQPVLALHYFGLGLPSYVFEESGRRNILQRSKTPLFNIDMVHPETDAKIKDFLKLNSTPSKNCGIPW